MMKFTLEIEMKGQAFEDPSELARIIKEQVLNRIDISNKSCGGIDGKVRDINGNTVGQWEIPFVPFWNKGERIMEATKEKAEYDIYQLILNKDEQLSEHHIGIVAKVLADNLDKLREVLAKVEGGEG